MTDFGMELLNKQIERHKATIAERDAEIAALKHDIERHIKIASEEATEVERLRDKLIDAGERAESLAIGRAHR